MGVYKIASLTHFKKLSSDKLKWKHLPKSTKKLIKGKKLKENGIHQFDKAIKKAAKPEK